MGVDTLVLHHRFHRVLLHRTEPGLLEGHCQGDGNRVVKPCGVKSSLWSRLRR